MSISSLPIREALTRENVDALLKGGVLAIWLKGFIGKEHCDHVYQRVREAPLKPLAIHYTRPDGTADYRYANVFRLSTDVQLDEYFDRLGGAERHPATMADYLAGVPAINALNSQLCAPFRRPCDVLFDALDEAYGIDVAQLDGRPLKFGTFLLNRKSPQFDDTTTIPIHVDTVPSQLFPDIEAQLGAMVYCRIPEVGGELRVYDHPMIERDSPIPPSVDHTVEYRALKPKAGDAILINSRRPPAVVPGGDGDRLANIMFIGSSGGRLKIWT
jgi:hypothetical protein